MASGSPRARIDQFFASTKRKPPPLKDEKPGRESRSKTPDGSPSAKGTLDCFLSKSPNAGSRPGFGGSGTPPNAAGLEAGYSSGSSRPEPIKRTLSLDIGLSSNMDRQAALDSCSLGLQKEARGEAPDDAIVVEQQGPAESSRGKLELKKFANDFLSLYCSELPSAENLLTWQELKGQKRNISPSLLVACNKTSMKKLCTVDYVVSTQEAVNAASSPDCAQPAKPEFFIKPAETMTALSGEHKEHVGNHCREGDGVGNVCVSLQICTTTPSSDLMKTGFYTAGRSANAIHNGETPKSSRRSMFSPGEEFWNEAIQVADGLLAPVKNLHIPLDEGHGAMEVQSQFLLQSGKSANEFSKDKSSSAVSQGAANLSGSIDGDVRAHGVAWNGCLQPNKKLIEETRESQAVQYTDASPLPVKHFDFAQEENNLMENDAHHCLIEKAEAGTSAGSEPADSSSVNGKCLQTSIILKPCEAKMSLEGKSNSPVHVSEDVSSGCPPSSTRSFRQTLCSASHLGVDERKDGALTEVSGTMEDDKIRPSEPPITEYCTPREEKGSKNRATSSCSHEESSTPSSSVLKDCLQLTSWLPSEVCSIYMKKGISKLYHWQVDCLLVDGVLDKRNLVYCASTSAGKSFVAEILMLRRVISTGKMAILVLPYVSICAEKTEHLELLLEPLGKHVRSFYGNQGGGSLPRDTSVAVCTIEKANSLVNRLLEEGRLSELGIIVIDELHMVGDQHRGYLLELMLTKLRYAAGEGISETSSGESCGSSCCKTDAAHGLQIVGMSATMPNVAAVADWLQAALYQTDFRPVPLEEYVKVGNTIFDKKLDVMRMIPKTADLGGKDPDHIVELCNEVVQEGHSVLLFCSSRKGCESTARHIARLLKKFEVGTGDPTCEFHDASSAIEALRRCPAGLDPVLQETLPSGVAYHHAGLTVEEREIIETCYRKGLVRVLTATSTLAAGVNLPARRVIFRQPRIGRDFIDGTRYKQMAGRAGRTGIDTKGESILICKPEEVRRITSILNDSCPPLQSCLAEDKNGMTHAILEVVAGGIVQTASDIHRYVRCTLFNSTKPFQDVVKSAQDSLRWLCHKKFLEWNEATMLYGTTPLGRASFGSSLSPEESLVVLDDLLRAREGFVLASDLHLVYLVTPINVDVEPDWELYHERFMELSALDQSVGNRVGVAEPFLMRMAHGAPVPVQDKLRVRKNGLNGKIKTWGTADANSAFSNEQALRVSKRFFVALMLSKLVQEVAVADVCEAFKVARGMIQVLQENAGRFAMMVSQFCERLGWHDLEGLVSKFQNRVSFGVRAEIVELTTIPYVKGSRARALYKAGLRTPLAVAEARVPEIAKALFESASWAGQEGSAVRHMQLGIAKKIKNGARKIILDQAEEARLAAFTAFKSLGVQVPQFSWPILFTNAEDSATQRSGKVCSGDDAISCFDNAVPDEGNISAPPAGNGKTERSDDISHKIVVENLSETANVSADLAGLDTIEGMQNSCNMTNSKLCEEPASIDSSLPVILHKNNAETSGVPIYPMVVGSSIGELDEHVQREQCIGKENGFNYSTGGVFDEGPVNACSVPGGFDSFLDQWDVVNEFCFDVHFTKRSELNSQAPFEVFGLAICWKSSPVYYINFPKDLMPSGELNVCGDVAKNSVNYISNTVAFCDMWEVIKHRWTRIAKIMRQNGVRKFTWNMKIQIQVLKIPCISIQRLAKLSAGYKELNKIELVDGSYLRLPSIFVHDGIDICLVAWILWPDEESKASPNLERLVKKHLSSEAAAAANQDGRWRNQMRKAAHNGCCRRVAQIRALSSVLWKLLVSENLVKVLNEIEIPLVKVLADMEIWGIGVDLEACLDAKHLLVKKLKELEKEAYSLAGISFSLYAAADISSVLFTCLKLQIPEGHNKGKQHPSTDKHTLDLLRGRHPIIAVIKEHRTLAKLLNSTMGSICSCARLCMKSQKYIIQGHWLQSSTATGRLSMEEPNLQCVEHAVVFTTHHSDGANTSCSDIDHHEINARDFFIPTQDNWLLLTADYSQIELRLMAHFSKDSQLIELLSKPDGDVFTMIAARWTAKPESTISSEDRDQTKRLVYGILYGMGANTLAEQLECSLEVAIENIQSFKTSFPGVSSWLHEAVASCRHRGYVETLMGRKRFLSNIKFGNSKEKAKAQRQAVNSICQGSAADIIKIAMINVHSVIAEGCETHTSKTGPATEVSMLKGHCRIILQVHDELVLEVDPCIIKQAARLLQMSMESAVSLLVPLHIKLKIGKTWGSLEPLQAE